MTLIHQHAKFRLRAQGILVANREGHEVLFGLDVAETQFVFTCAECGIAGLDAADATLYFQLRHKHLQARLNVLFRGERVS